MHIFLELNYGKTADVVFVFLHDMPPDSPNYQSNIIYYYFVIIHLILLPVTVGKYPQQLPPGQALLGRFNKDNSSTVRQGLHLFPTHTTRGQLYYQHEACC